MSRAMYYEHTIKKLDEDIPNLSVALKLRFDGPYEIMGSMKRILGIIDPSNYNTISFDLNIIVFPEGKTFNILKIGNWFNLQVNRIASPSGHLTQYAYFIHFENGGKSGNAHSTNPLTCRSNVWQKVFLIYSILTMQTNIQAYVNTKWDVFKCFYT